MRNFSPYIYIVLFLTLVSCGNDPLKVDVTDTPVKELTIDRLEQDVFKMDTSDIAGATKKLQANYNLLIALLWD